MNHYKYLIISIIFFVLAYFCGCTPSSDKPTINNPKIISGIAAKGAIAVPIDVNLDVPIVVHGGEWFQIVFRQPVGTATGSQIIRVLALVNGYFE